MAGSRDELFEFSEECRPMTNVNIEFSMSSVNFFLPSHKFFEVLYNRFGFDERYVHISFYLGWRTIWLSGNRSHRHCAIQRLKRRAHFVLVNLRNANHTLKVVCGFKLCSFTITHIFV